MDDARLTTMANQIAGFFATQPGDAAKATADHLKSFWDPRMRKAIAKHVQEGGAGLDPTALAAVHLLIQTTLPEATTIVPPPSASAQ